jgi:serine/threonine-protein kinase
MPPGALAATAPPLEPIPISAAIGPGVSLGSYQILEPLGEGGMGQVFIAQHTRLGKRVAIKVLRPEYATNPSTLRRFFQEAQAAGQIENPHIVQIFDFGDDGPGRNYIVMELLNGADLSQIRQRDGPIALPRMLSIVRQIGAGLAAAHDRAIIHRDLKPENVFLVRDEGADYVKLLDFGLAKLSDSRYGSVAKSQFGMVMGTPDFMSPEQAAGTAVDARTDLYSFATLVYWMVAGVLPFQAETFSQILIQRATQPAPPLPSTSASGERVPTALREAVARGLEQAPDKRPSNVREFVRLIEESLGARAGPSPAQGSRALENDLRAAGLDPPRATGRRLLWPIAGAALLAAGLGAWFVTHAPAPAETPSPSTAARTLPRPAPAPPEPPPAVPTTHPAAAAQPPLPSPASAAPGASANSRPRRQGGRRRAAENNDEPSAPVVDGTWHEQANGTLQIEATPAPTPTKDEPDSPDSLLPIK